MKGLMYRVRLLLTASKVHEQHVAQDRVVLDRIDLLRLRTHEQNERVRATLAQKGHV